MGYVIGIGAQKAGTTWLAEYFYAHDQVFMSPYKEMHYFDACHEFLLGAENWRRFARRWNIDLRKYGANNGIVTQQQVRDLQRLYLASCFRSDRAYRAFLDYGATGKRISVEITPTYTDLGEAGFRHMAKCLPDVKLVLIARNPVDRFISQVRMDRAKNKKRGDWPIDRLLAHRHYNRKGDYRRTLLEAQKAVSPDRIHVVFYERLFDANARESELRRICDFAGIAYRAPMSDERSNAARDKSFDLDDAGRRQVTQHYAEVMRFMAQYEGGLPNSWQADLDKL